MIYVDNLSECIWNIIRTEVSGVFYPQNAEYVNTFNLIQEIANCHNHKIIGLSIFNPIIKVLVRHNRLFNKVFGNLFYSKEMSQTSDFNYQIVTFDVSIKKTES